MISEALRKNIRVETDINVFPCRIHEIDFCVILINVLENAIEAAEQSEDAGIFISVKNREDRTFLRIKNRYAIAPIEENGVLKTTKPDAAHHGFGLVNVKDVIKKNSGTYWYQYDANYFETVIIL